MEVRSLPGLNLTAWDQELQDDSDKKFILEGIENGFDIIDPGSQIPKVSCLNHPSARPSSVLFPKGSERVLKKLNMEIMAFVMNVPLYQPYGAVPKADNDVRLIHDCSRPTGQALNNLCSADWKQKFARVDDAAGMMTKGCYMARVDLRKAYRSLPISRYSQQVIGLSWELNGRTIYMKDTKLPFGARYCVSSFHRLTQAVKRIMARKGYDLLVVYLDDFLVIAESQEECAQALLVLIQLLRKLGLCHSFGEGS